MNPASVTITTRCRRIVVVVALGALLPYLHSQTAPIVSATAADSVTKTDAVVRNPFEVTTDKDTGYVAASSLAGGRANTPLKLTPASISVMTQEFMDDLNITNLTEAIGWTVNVETRTQENLNQGPFGSFEMNFRNSG